MLRRFTPAKGSKAFGMRVRSIPEEDLTQPARPGARLAVSDRAAVELDDGKGSLHGVPCGR